MNKTFDSGISIITIVFNGESLIEQTIQSVITQENVNLEYIIIDGGSTDGTLQRIAKYKNQIDLIISEPDNGIYHAINKGINLATKELIGLIHCGDFYEPKVLQKVYNEFKKNSADIVYGDINILEEFSTQTIVHSYKANHTLLKKKMSIFHPATFVKRECYIQNGLYNTNYIIASDYELFMNFCLKRLKFQYVPEILANFRTGGISASKSKLSFKENFRIRKEHLGIKVALVYIISTIPVHLYYTGRKFCVEFIIGKKNYLKLKFYLFNRKND